MLEAVAYGAAFRQRKRVPGQHQRGAHERLAQLTQQQTRHRVIGNTDSYCAATLVLQAPWGLARCGQQKCVGARGCSLQQPELPRLDLRETADLAQVAAHESEMMMTVCLADAADALERVLVADVAAERIAGISRIGDDAARPHDIRRASDQ